MNNEIKFRKDYTRLARNQEVITKVLKQENNNLLKIKDKNSRDCFIKSEYDSYKTYSKSIMITDTTLQGCKLVNGYITREVLDILNGAKMITSYDNTVFVQGLSFSIGSIPKIDESEYEEIKAIDNVIDFGSNNYFKYVSSDGKEHHVFTASDGRITEVASEYFLDMENSDDAVLSDYVYFWNRMTSESLTYMGLTYSEEEIEAYMKEIGLKPGFFTIKMGDREVTNFYSESDIRGCAISKREYDTQYEFITKSGRYASDLSVGHKVKIKDKEYEVKSDYTIDIPYGADIFNIDKCNNKNRRVVN